MLYQLSYARVAFILASARGSFSRTMCFAIHLS